MFYSKTTGGFYDTAIHGDSIPADAVEITAEEHASLLAEQAAGKVIQPDVNGHPVALDPPPPTEAELKAGIDAKVQDAIDAKAQARGYKDAATCISYMNSSNPTWAGEAASMSTWRDNCWAYTIQQEALNPLPTPEAVVAGLPSAPW